MTSSSVRDQPFYEWSVANDAANIQNVPPHMITETMALKAVLKNAYLIEYIPEALRTEEVCAEAIKDDTVFLLFPKPIRYCDKVLNAYFAIGLTKPLMAIEDYVFEPKTLSGLKIVSCILNNTLIINESERFVTIWESIKTFIENNQNPDHTVIDTLNAIFERGMDLFEQEQYFIEVDSLSDWMESDKKHPISQPYEAAKRAYITMKEQVAKPTSKRFKHINDSLTL